VRGNEDSSKAIADARKDVLPHPPQQNLANDYQAQLAVDTLILNGGMPATGMLN
jgi:hypothetical protein